MTGHDGNVFTDDGISTHTPLTGRDLPAIRNTGSYDIFLLTRPLRDVTDVTGF